MKQTAHDRVTYDPYDRKLLSVYFAAFLYILRLALQFLPFLQKVNDIKTGDINKTNASSNFTYATCIALTNFTEFLFVRYNSALSDYVGRKPILVLSSLVFAVSHFLLASRTEDSIFYVAAVIGSLSQSGNIFAAWINDLVSLEDRGKALGLLTGISIGLGFTIGIAMGVGLSEAYGYNVPLYLSAATSIFAGVFTIFLPVNDKTSSLLKVNKDQGNELPGHEGRALPSSVYGFIVDHNPMYGLNLIREGKHPLNWLSFFFSFTAQQVLNITFINFAIEAFGWSTLESGAVVAVIGVSVAVFASIMCSIYEDLGLYTIGAISSSIGLMLLAISGSHVDGNFVCGIFGVLFIAFGGFYFSTMQSLITKQYEEDRQGEVTGVLSQTAQLTNVVAYPTSLLFSYMISSESQTYWPGVIYFLASIYHIVGVSLHFHSHGPSSLKLNKRSKALLTVAKSDSDVH